MLSVLRLRSWTNGVSQKLRTDRATETETDRSIEIQKGERQLLAIIFYSTQVTAQKSFNSMSNTDPLSMCSSCFAQPITLEQISIPAALQQAMMNGQSDRRAVTL